MAQSDFSSIFKLYKDIKILSPLPSFRNEVYKAEAFTRSEKVTAVLKLYLGAEGTALCSNECENLQRLRANSLYVPELLDAGENALLLRYIEGDTINALTERQELGAWIEKLADWLCKMHSIQDSCGSLLKKDVNLRNFIYSEGRIYGLDFEETERGKPLKDIADICFFFLTDTPSFTRKKRLMVRRFLEAYRCFSGQELEELPAELLLARSRAVERRKAHRKQCEI